MIVRTHGFPAEQPQCFLCFVSSHCIIYDQKRAQVLDKLKGEHKKNPTNYDETKKKKVCVNLYVVKIQKKNLSIPFLSYHWMNFLLEFLIFKLGFGILHFIRVNSMWNPS